MLFPSSSPPPFSLSLHSTATSKKLPFFGSLVSPSPSSSFLSEPLLSAYEKLMALLDLPPSIASTLLSPSGELDKNVIGRYLHYIYMCVPHISGSVDATAFKKTVGESYPHPSPLIWPPGFQRGWWVRGSSDPSPLSEGLSRQLALSVAQPVQSSLQDSS